MENTQDLDKARDEKVVPVALGILNDMAVDMVPENAAEKIDFNPVVLKILQRQLDSDLNITTEVPYVYQLLLGAFAALNQAAQVADSHPIDDIRYGAIGKKILGFLATANIDLLATPEEMTKAFEPVRAQLSELFVAEKLTLIEIKYVMDNLFEAFNMVQSAANASVEQNMAKAEAKLFGVEAMSDVSLGRLDQVLKGEPLPALVAAASQEVDGLEVAPADNAEAAG